MNDNAREVGMRAFVGCVVAAAFLLLATAGVAARDDSRADLEAAIDSFSRTTTVGGGGWEMYSAFLHEGFTRCYAGTPVVERDALVASVKDWWESGMRVAEDESHLLRLDVVGDVGIARLEVLEKFVDSDSVPAGEFHGFVTQVWVRGTDGWKLLSLEISPAKG
jgi:hypothetical protein